MYFARTNIGEGPQTPECDNNAPLPRSANGWNVRTEKVGKTHRRECVPPYLGGTGAYWGPISVLWARNGGPEPKMEPGRSPACARAAETWATSLHVTYSRRLETARDGDRIPRLVAHL